MKKLLTLLALIVLSCCSKEVNEYDIILKKIDKSYQVKLDSGKFMLKTEREYSIRLDSLMQKVYKNLLTTKKAKKHLIEIEQNKWSLQRKLKIENIRKQNNKLIEEIGFIPNDVKLLLYNEKSQATRKRVLELIHQLQK